MDLRAYIDILRRRGWIILLVAALAGAATFGISYLQTKIYRATVKISAVPARPDWGLGNSAKDLLRNFVNNINTHDRANDVIRAARLDMSSYELLSKITVSAEPENFLIRIDAKDQDPQVARLMALTMANQFVDERLTYYSTQDKRDRIDVKLVDSVVDPVVYQPKPLTNALAGLVLGGLIGAMIVLALEWLEADILATPEGVERALGLPVLGTSPAMDHPGKSGTAGRGTHMTANLVTLTDPGSPAAESYRRLRTNLSFAGGEQPLQALLVAAAGPDENKASVVANLAVAFAKVGKRVILMDCDLRHPAQHTLFGFSNTAGVTTALDNPGGTLPLQATEVPCLHVLTSGPAVPVPSDLIGSISMVALINRLRSEADILLLDAPPVVLATDAAELAAQVDGVLLTVQAGHTKRDDAQRARDLLARAGARVVGAVLANVQADAALRKYLAA